MAITPTTPLTVLRLALPGQPSSRDLAKRIGCSHNLLHKFERGEFAMGEDLLARYAKAVNASLAEVQKRWLFAALDATQRRRLEIQSQLSEMGVKDHRPRKRRRSA